MSFKSFHIYLDAITKAEGWFQLLPSAVITGKGWEEIFSLLESYSQRTINEVFTEWQGLEGTA